MNTPVYEDAVVRVSLAEDAAAQGHVLIETQRGAKRLSELSPDESAHFFLVTSYAAAILFQGVQAQGTNIIVNESEERLTAHVVARRPDDGLDFTWTPSKADDGSLDDAAERIKDKTFGLAPKKAKKEQKEPKEAPKEQREPREPKELPADPTAEAEAKENYLIKQLIRIP